MPVIPDFENTLATPIAPGPPRIDPSIAAQPGQALANAGAAISAEANEWGARYVEARRQADASQLASNGTSQLGDAAFKWSKTPDHVAATAGFNADAKAITENLIAQSNDPLVQSYVQRELGHTQALVGLEVQRQSFGVESSARRGDLDNRMLGYQQQAALAPTQELRANAAAQAKADVAGSVAAGWIQPQEGDTMLRNFGSSVAEVAAKQMILNNPSQAAAILGDPAKAQAAFPGLLPNMAENLASRAENRAYRLEVRAAAAQAHADSVANRELVRTQGFNAATLMARALNGEVFNPSDIAARVGTGQLSESGFNAVVAAGVRGQEGNDVPSVILDLHQRLNDGSLKPDDVTNALNSRQIKATSAVTLMSAIGAQDKGEFNQVRNDAFRALDSALGGGAIDKGLVNLDNVPMQALVARRASAQLEFDQRVDKNREDPQAVAQDIINRYSSPPQVPNAWPKPRMGAVSSAADIPNVAAATVQAFQNGQMTQAQYDAERQLLGRLDAYYRSLPPARTPNTGGPAKGSAPRGLAGPPAGLTPTGTE